MTPLTYFDLDVTNKTVSYKVQICLNSEWDSKIGYFSFGGFKTQNVHLSAMVGLWNCSQGNEEVPSYSKQNKSWLFSLIWVCARTCLHDSKKGWCNNFRFCPYICRCFAADFLDLSLSVVLTHVVRLPLGGFYFIFDSSLSFDFFTEEGIWAGFGDFWGKFGYYG